MPCFVDSSRGLIDHVPCVGEYWLFVCGWERNDDYKAKCVCLRLKQFVIAAYGVTVGECIYMSLVCGGVFRCVCLCVHALECRWVSIKYQENHQETFPVVLIMTTCLPVPAIST